MLLWNIILQLSTPTSTASLQSPHLLNHRHQCHLANALKTYCEQAKHQNLHVWNNHAVWVFQTTPYNWLLSNTWATCYLTSNFFWSSCKVGQVTQTLASGNCWHGSFMGWILLTQSTASKLWLVILHISSKIIPREYSLLTQKFTCSRRIVLRTQQFYP